MSFRRLLQQAQEEMDRAAAAARDAAQEEQSHDEPPEEEQEDFRNSLLPAGVRAATSEATRVEDAVSTAVTTSQRIQEDTQALAEVEEGLTEAGLLTSTNVAAVERSIREIEQLRRIAMGSPCVDVELQEPNNNNNNNNNNTNTSDPEDPEDPADVFTPPLLIPRMNIEKIISGGNREVTVINRNLYDDDLWILGQPFDGFTIPRDAKKILISEPGTEVDAFRYAAGKFWYFDGFEEKFAKVDNLAGDQLPKKVIFDIINVDEAFMQQLSQWHALLRLEFQGDYSEPFLDTYVRGANSQGWQGLPPNLKGTFAEPLIKDNITTKEFFIDSVFSAEQPFYKKELDKMQVSQFTSVDINASITTLDKEEKREFYLPSLYRMYSNKKNDEDFKVDCEYEDRVQKFPVEAVLELSEANELAGSFNNFVEIEINTQQGTNVATLLHEFRMDKHILDMLTSDDIKPGVFTEVMDEDLFNATQVEGDSSIYQELSPYSYLRNDAVEVRVTERVLDYVDNRIKQIPNRTLADYENMRTDHYPIPFENYDRPGLLRFADTLRSQMFLSKLKDYLTNDKYRSFPDIINGEKAYSEIIGYRIAKHEIKFDETAQDEILDPIPIQEFYLMDSDEVTTIKFIDTQIATGKQYMYRIHSLNFVVGSLYQYGIDGVFTETSVNGNSQRVVAEILTMTTPIIRIIEAPFFERVVSTQEKPPMFPQVSFLPYQGIADKMQILIQSNFGESMQEPIQILESDAEVITRMRRAQDVNNDAKIMYKNDSLPKSFQIFRLEQAPNTYADFANSDYIKTVEPTGRTLLHVEENFEPNKDYYYMFREVDDMGISNPTEVFRVKMVSYQNGIYMDMEAYEMQPVEEPKIQISFERALQIVPSLIQRSVKFEDNIDLDTREFALSVPDNVDIGNNKENSVWGRKFKARLISKTSGRRIDVNFKFVKNITKRELDTIAEASETENPCPESE